VYANHWLEDFFKALTEHREWIRIRHFSEVLDDVKPIGRIYLPNASYAEMLHWVLRPRQFSLYEEIETELKNQGKLEKYEPFFKGGFWRNFFVKYPEINAMHKKMLRVSQRARRFQRHHPHPPKALATAFEHLWAAQCNDPYWHGVFGGFYLPVLRYPIFHNLISAEKLLDTMEERTSITIDIVDVDCDGQDEVIVETPAMNCYIKPDHGGFVFELDFKSISLNLIDVVTRREEGYHTKLTRAKALQSLSEGAESIHNLVLTKEEGLERYLQYDWYRRGSLIDHFFGSATTLDEVSACSYTELGDFVNQPYEVKRSRRGEEVVVELVRNGTIWRGEIRHGIQVRKTLTFRPQDAEIDVEYRITNRETQPVDVWFGVELAFGLQAGDAPDRYYYLEGGVLGEKNLRSVGEVRDTPMLGLRDEWLGVDVRIETDKPATFWRFPIETISLSEEGFEKIYQGSVVIPHWRFRLDNQWRMKLVQRCSRLKKSKSRIESQRD
jgi:alpha-amylase